MACLLDPGAELGVFGGPFFDPCAQMERGFGGVAQVVEPAQFGQAMHRAERIPFPRSGNCMAAGAAVVAGLAWEMVEGVAQPFGPELMAEGEVDAAALPGGLGEHFGDGALEPGVIVADGQAHAAQAARLEPKEELPPELDALSRPASSTPSQRP